MTIPLPIRLSILLKRIFLSGLFMIFLYGYEGWSWCEVLRPGGNESIELRLSLPQAIEIGMGNNYDLMLAKERISEARGVAFTRLGALLPNLSGETNLRNLRVFQGQFGGRPAVSDPRDIYDLRGRLSQSIFNLSLIQQWREGNTGVDVAELDAEVIRRDTIFSIALLYFEALRGEKSVEAREANVELSRILWKMAEGRKAAGAATGLDVTRAEVQYQTERQRLLDAVIERNRARLNLIRAMGLPNHTRVILIESFKMVPTEQQSPDEAVKTALTNRVELTAQDQRRLAARLRLDAVKGERIPSLDVRGDYGLIGEQFDTRFSSHSVGAFLSIPIFDGGQREGRIQEINSQLQQERLRLDNLVHQISIDARDSLLNLEVAQERVLVSQKRLELALKELELSRKAFAIGSVTHIEVLNAQTAVANARDNVIDALFDFHAARINVARSQGRVELIYVQPMLQANRGTTFSER